MAFYVDTEGHAISYTVSVADDQRRVTFLSEPLANQPRYRLTYRQLAPGRMSVVLESAPAGQPDHFATIVDGVVRRQ